MILMRFIFQSMREFQQIFGVTKLPFQGRDLFNVLTEPRRLAPCTAFRQSKKCVLSRFGLNRGILGGAVHTFTFLQRKRTKNKVENFWEVPRVPQVRRARSHNLKKFSAMILLTYHKSLSPRQLVCSFVALVQLMQFNVNQNSDALVATIARMARAYRAR